MSVVVELCEPRAWDMSKKGVVAKAYKATTAFTNGNGTKSLEKGPRLLSLPRVARQFKSLNDSIYTIENGQRLSELQTIYETEKKEAALALQQEEIKTLTEKAKVDTLTKGLYAGGMVSARNRNSSTHAQRVRANGWAHIVRDVIGPDVQSHIRAKTSGHDDNHRVVCLSKKQSCR